MKLIIRLSGGTWRTVASQFPLVPSDLKRQNLCVPQRMPPPPQGSTHKATKETPETNSSGYV